MEEKFVGFYSFALDIKFEGKEIKRTSKAVQYKTRNGKEVWIPNKAVASNSLDNAKCLKNWFKPDFK